ncbi:uncharacterized protein EI90DRAFT_3053338 [Cantharellus anzutake]|uniref:uncharacterized protein n=1 Tax=Cantharellus anzutake TaxID=1750568 RepID=UPI001904A9D4|nr:uncharacterized protein EI90DRAFT_3053338 [Cantharellus anzutake]KAF8333200.1 hypothetical protein EI90DRAFT_3053338 [Cantharellus anzutake]
MAAPSPFNRQRRGASPALLDLRERKPVPPAGPLGLPNPSFLNELTGSFGGRSITDSPTSEDGEDTNQPHVDVWGDPRRNRSYSAAAGFADLTSRMTTAVSNIASQPRSPSLKSDGLSQHLSDAEIEAEAIREREHSRREAERILLQEAEERRRAEDRREAFYNSPNPRSPDRRRDTIDVPSASPKGHESPSTPPSKGSRWWNIAKQKLSPSRDEDVQLTPAQEIIRETQQKQQQQRKDEGEEGKRRMKANRDGWPASPKAKTADPALTAIQTISPKNKLSTPNGSPRPIQSNSPQRLHSPMTPPQVPQAVSTTNLSFSPSGPRPSAISRPSESDNVNSMYNQFNPQTGALDIPATLLTVTARFEKLERWTVNHVRALEERMKDVERYLVDREGREDAVKKDVNNLKTAMLQIRSELQQIQAASSPVYVPLHLPPSPSPGPTAAGNYLVPVAASVPVPAPTSVTTLPTPKPVGARQPISTGKVVTLQAPSPVPASPMSMTSISASSTGIASSSTSRSYHSATASPSQDAVRPSTPRRNSQSSVDEMESSVNGSPSGSETTGATGTVRSINFRNRLPYPSGDYYDLPKPDSHQLSASSTRSLSPPVMDRSQTASPVLPPPRSVSPLVLPPVDFGKPQSIPVRDDSESPLGLTKGEGKTRVYSKTPSPTPRKRYTVALSGRHDDDDRKALNADEEHQNIIGARKVHTALVTDSPPPLANQLSLTSFSTSSHDSSVTDSGSSAPTSEPSPEFHKCRELDTAIGSTPVHLSRLSLSPPPSLGSPPGLSSPIRMTGRTRTQSTMESTSPVPSPVPASPSPGAARKRAQSAVQDGLPPLSSRLARLGLGESSVVSSGGQRPSPNPSDCSGERCSDVDVFSKGSFVDPLVIRRKEKERRSMEVKMKQNSVSSAASARKIPVAKLAAFFDTDTH